MAYLWQQSPAYRTKSIPESESFRFESIAKDEKENPIINAVVDVYDENNQKLFTTLTDENGHYLFNLSSKNNHSINPAPFGQNIKLCPKDFILSSNPTVNGGVLKDAG